MRFLSNRTTLRRTVALSLLLVVLGAWVAADADEWGSQDENTGAHPDPDPHTYCFSSSVPASSDLRENIGYAEWNAMDPTGVNVNGPESCDLSSGTETDVVWRQVNLANNTLAETPCEDYDGSYCDQYYINMDLPEINEGNNDERDQTITACHELGHSGGLSHGSTQNDCMENVSTINPPADIKYRRYSSHHINDHLNPWFN